MRQLGASRVSWPVQKYHLLQDFYLRDAGHHEPENICECLFGIRVAEHSFSDHQRVGK